MTDSPPPDDSRRARRERDRRGPQAPETAPTAAIPADQAGITPAAAGPNGSVGPDRPDDSSAPDTTASAKAAARQRLLIYISIGVIAVMGVALAFIVGNLLGGPAAAPAPSPTRSATPTPTPTPAPTPTAVVGPVAPGTYDWDELGGRECLDPYVSPWELSYSVVDCAQPHPAQLVVRGSFAPEPEAAYPGEPALVSQLALLCSDPSVIDYGAAGAYPDVQLQSSYPATAEQWAEGQRSYFCFASLAGGGLLTGSIAVPAG